MFNWKIKYDDILERGWFVSSNAADYFCRDGIIRRGITNGLDALFFYSSPAEAKQYKP